MISGMLLLFCGCGSSETAWISGDVVFDGKKVSGGALRFFPTDGTPGSGGGAEIVDGHYEVTPEMAKKKGMLAGSYRISVVASRKTGKKYPNPDGGMLDHTVMYIPPRYNRQTKLLVELKPGKNDHNLILER